MHFQRVKVALVDHRQVVGGTQGQGQGAGVAMNALSDGTQALRSVVHGVHRRHDRQQTLGGANVGRGLVPSNMLFAGLQGHAQGGLAQTVDGDANDSAWKMALEPFAGRKKRSMRSSVTHGHSKPLRTSNHHIGTHGAWAFQHQQGHQVSRKDGPHFALGHVGHKSSQIFHLPVGVGVLDHASEDVARLHGPTHRLATHHHHVDVEVRRAGAQHTQRLGKHRLVHQESAFACLHLRTGACCEQHRHGLCGRRAFIEKRSVGHFHARQIHDHGLEIQKRFQTALRDFSLVRRVGSVPPRILEHIAANDTRHFRGVVAHPDVVPEHGVLTCQTVDVLQIFTLRQGLGHAQPLAQSDRPRDGAFDEVVERRRTKGTEHGGLVFFSRTQMTRGETSNLHDNQGIGR